MKNIRGYLRLRSSLALAILVAAGVAAFVVSSVGHKGVMESSRNAQVLGQLLVSTSIKGGAILDHGSAAEVAVRAA